ncbi:MAG TPA: MXAN_5187 C-terminal domain-containing protein [Vulgatibacter sp.]
MPRPSLLLLTLAALAAGGANLYLGGIEAVRNAERRLDDRLDRAAKSLRTILTEEAGSQDAGGEPAAFDDAKARRLAALAGADVTFIRAGKLEASSLGSAARGEVERGFGAGAAGPFGAGGIPPTELELFGVPLPLFETERPAFRGHGTTVPGIAKLDAVLTLSTLDEYGAIAAAQTRELAVGGGLLVLALLILLSSGRRKEPTKVISTLADVAERAADGDATAHAAEFHPGDLGRLARALNRLSSRAKLAGATHSTSNQFTLSGPPPAEPPADVADSFPFGAQQAPEAAAGHDAGNRVAETPERTPGPFAEHLEAAAAPPPPPEPKAAPAWEMPQQEPAAEPAWSQPTRPAVTELPAPPPPPTAPPPADPYGQAIAEAVGGGAYNPEATVVAQIPEALLRATSRATAPAAPIDPEELHIEQVFQEFVRLRQECGEPTGGLTLEKFASKLRSNRAQLIEKYRCRTVRFTAYVKDGKAALKASPVKDSA